jgi:hypothetical protein
MTKTKDTTWSEGNILRLGTFKKGTSYVAYILALVETTKQSLITDHCV